VAPAPVPPLLSLESVVKIFELVLKNNPTFSGSGEAKERVKTFLDTLDILNSAITSSGGCPEQVLILSIRINLRAMCPEGSLAFMVVEEVLTRPVPLLPAPAQPLPPLLIRVRDAVRMRFLDMSARNRARAALSEVKRKLSESPASVLVRILNLAFDASGGAPPGDPQQLTEQELKEHLLRALGNAFRLHARPSNPEGPISLQALAEYIQKLWVDNGEAAGEKTWAVPEPIPTPRINYISGGGGSGGSGGGNGGSASSSSSAGRKLAIDYSKPPSTPCPRCGQYGHWARACANCARCGQQGHFATSCSEGDESARTKRAASVAASKKQYSDSAYLRPPVPPPRVSLVDPIAPHSTSLAPAPSEAEHRRVWVSATFGGVAVVACADSAASWTTIGPSHLIGARYTRSNAPFLSAMLADGGKGGVLGIAHVNVKIGDHRPIVAACIILEGATDILLGTDVLDELGALDALETALRSTGATVHRSETVPSVASVSAYPEDVCETIEAFKAFDLSHIDEDLREGFRGELIKRRKAFLRDGCMPPACKHPAVKLVLKPGAGAPAVQKARAWSPMVRAEIVKHTEAGLHFGVYVPVHGTPLYERRAEPLVVWKDDGSSRMVIDESALNPQLVTSRYPIPNMVEQITKFGPFMRASTLDLAQGYTQCEVDEESRVHNTFRGPNSLLQSTRLLMGQSPSGGLFCEIVQKNIIERMRKELQDEVPRYVDDLGHGTKAKTDREAQIKEMATVLEMLDAVIAGGNTLRLKKCNFVNKKIKFTGVEMIAGTRRLVPERASAVTNFGPVRTKTDLRRFLALGDPWRAWIKGYWSLAQPLRQAARGRGPLAATPEMLAAIDLLKTRVATSVHLAIPDMSRDFDMTTDASELGLGVIVEQDAKVISYWGRPLNRAEAVRPAYDREWLCIIEGLEHAETITGGARIHVNSDHETLEGLESSQNRDKSGKRAELYERSTKHRFDVRYVPRNDPKQEAADAISKSPAFRESREAESSAPASTSEEIRAVPESIPPPRVSPTTAALSVTTPVRTDAATWRERQLRDPKFAAIIEFKEKGTIPKGVTPSRSRGIANQAQHMEIHDGALYHISRVRSEAWTQLAIPDVDGLREKKLKVAHEVESVHESGTKMFERLRRLFWWDTMLSDCIRYYKQCDPCWSRKAISNKYGMLDPTTSKKLKGAHRVALDLFGPLPLTSNGNTFMAVTVDCDTSRTLLTPLKNSDSASIIPTLIDRVFVFSGIPQEFLTDRASNLNSKLVDDFLTYLNIEKKTTSTENPMADGGAEAMVKLGKNMTAILVATKGIEWDASTPGANLSLASMFKEPLKASPFFAERGREMVLPSFFDQPLAEVDPPTIKDMKELHKKFVALRDEAAAEMKRYYDRGREEADFEAGDKVWLAKHKRDNTLDMRRIGPFEVEKTLGPLDVKLKDILQGPKLGRTHEVVNVKHLDHYNGIIGAGRAPLHKVEAILKHQFVQRKKGKQARYLVKWSEGDETWEPTRSLVDEADNGEFIFNEALLSYWKSHPNVKKREGY
jgi:hypothetical protein